MSLGTDGLITVVGDFDALDNAPVSGRVTFTPSCEIKRGSITYPELPTTVALDADGQFSIKLPATDDPAVSPNGFTYKVDIVVTAYVNGRAISVPKSENFALSIADADAAGVAQLNDLLPAPAVGTPTPYLTLAAANTRYLLKTDIPELPSNIITEDNIGEFLEPVDLTTYATKTFVTAALDDVDISGVVKTINGSTPDANGSLTLTLPSPDLTGYAKTADIGATVNTGVATAFAATKPQDVRAAPLASRSTTGIEFVSDPGQAAGPVVVGSAIGLTTGSSLYGPVIVRVDDKGLSGKKYRMLLSTDHDPNAGGIWVLEADAVTGPWTNIKTDLTAAFTDTAQGKQSETPWPVWEPLSQQWYVYYQQDYGSINGTQKTCLAITSDFVTWERVGVVIDPPVGLFPGTGTNTFHTGYAQVTRRAEGDWIAHHLCGSGNYTRYATSYSRDGVTWITDPTQKTGALSRIGADDRRCFPTGRLFRLNGELFATSVISSFVSGAASGSPVAVAGRIAADLNSWITTPEVLWRAKYDWEQGGAGSSVFIDTDGTAWLTITNGFKLGFAKANFRVEGVIQ
ncbi:hypothetical protein [Kineococcus sp. R86509]|uniref:hypothetical protein n=1 Tax=Kineococcus sp. R86509 TaxID=3093851 RepID=UPI0036D22299